MTVTDEIDEEAFQAALPFGPDDEFNAFHLDEGNLRAFLARYLRNAASARESVDPEIDKEIAELLVGVLTHGFSSGTFRTESILAAIRANFDIRIQRRG